MSFNVYSIFQSISGEVGIVPQGTITTFIRLAGCNLKCAWCDTAKTQSPDSGNVISIDEVIKQVIMLGSEHVLITGGEPLLQAEALKELLLDDRFQLLRDKGNVKWRPITIETNGTLLEAAGGINVNLIIDYKLPSSNEQTSLSKFCKQIEDLLDENEIVIKMVCTTDEDIAEGIKVYKAIKKYNSNIPVAFSATKEFVPILFKRLLKNHITDAIVNIQIHKLIWPEGEVEK